jgi:acetylornithine/N-succinyldiaminopimelate aminotransferase
MATQEKAMADTATLTTAEREARVHLQVYARQPITLVRGEGCRVWDEDGRAYLDLVAGIAVDVLGHAHPAVADALAVQARKLLTTSNLYYTLPQIELAEALTARSPFDRAFFTNSGTEANEAAIKLARRHGGQRGAHEIVSLTGSFHGRTFGSLAATAQPKYQQPFAPLPEGFFHVAANDTDALRTAVTEHTAAILIEPIQGESGIHPLADDFLLAARAAAHAVGALLIFDEIQTGVGRTGTFFAFEQTPVVPDVVTVAKGLGGCRSAPCWCARTRPPSGSATTARRSAATRSCVPPPWRRSASSTRSACSTTPAPWARASPMGSSRSSSVASRPRCAGAG